VDHFVNESPIKKAQRPVGKHAGEPWKACNRLFAQIDPAHTSWQVALEALAKISRQTSGKEQRRKGNHLQGHSKAIVKSKSLEPAWKVGNSIVIHFTEGDHQLFYGGWKHLDAKVGNVATAPAVELPQMWWKISE